MPRPAVIVLLAMGLLIPPTVAAEEGFGVSPAEIEIAGAQHGVSYREYVTVQNEFDSETTVSLNLTGDLASWTTLGRESGFTMKPRSQARLNVTITIPQDAVNGSYEGKLHITADEKDQPSGSGASIRHSVAVLLDVRVGGEPHVDIVWRSPEAVDVEVGSPPRVSAQVVNQGNVLTEVGLRATITPLPDGDAVAKTEATLEVIPGEERRVHLPFESALAEGIYRAHIVSTGPGDLDENVTFKVVPPGTLGKDGLLRFFDLPRKVQAGQPVKVAAVFENVGNATISRAKARAEVLRDGQRVAVLESDPLVVSEGEEVNLTDYFTPEEPGRYTIKGYAVYDGFRTETKRSSVQVAGQENAAQILPGNRIWLGLALFGFGGTCTYVLVRRGDDDDDE